MFLSLHLPSLLIPMLLFPQTPATSTPATQPVAMTTYKSDPLHFSYSYPAVLLNQSSMAEQAMKDQASKGTAVEKAVVGCVSIPVTAIDATATFRMVVIARMDAKCLGSPLTPEALTVLASSILGESLKKMGTTTIAPATNYTVDGHSAALVLGTAQSAELNMTFHAAGACLMTEGDAVCWELIATDQTALNTMAAYPLTFTDHAPIPLIPANLLTK